MNRRFWTCLILVLGAVLLQLRWQDAWRWSPDFVLVTLVTLGFFWGALELVWYSALSVLLLNWRPGPAPELVVFGLLPLVLFLLRKAAPWDTWTSSLISNTLALGLFYAAGHSFRAWDHPDFIVSLALGLIYSSLLFGLLKYVAGYEVNSAKRSIFQ